MFSLSLALLFWVVDWKEIESLNSIKVKDESSLLLASHYTAL